MKEIIINQIIKTNRKTMALIIQPDGSLVVRAPRWATKSQINGFVSQKSGWILKKQAEVTARGITSQAKGFVEGEKFLFLGKEYPIILVDRQRQALELDGGFRLARNAQHAARQVFTRWYQKHAREVITARVVEYASLYGFKYSKIGITGARTRWGSCSLKGSLNFSWRLVMAPMDIIDYVVIHELVHLRQHNHSRAFWKELAEIMPDYAARRGWLTKNGPRFTLG